jgi:putative 235 kDa rhoptry protein
LLNYSYKEVNLFYLITSAKIFEKEAIELYFDKKINFKYTIRKLNDLIKITGNEGKIRYKSNYVYYLSEFKVNHKNMKRIFIFNALTRQKMIKLMIILNKRKFSIYRFEKIRSEFERKHIKKDLQVVLSEIKIDYTEYISLDSENALNLVISKIENFSDRRQKYLKEQLLKIYEKFYSNSETLLERAFIGVIKKELGIKRIKRISNLLFDFLERNFKKLSRNEIYDFFSYFLINLKDEKANKNGTITRKDRELKRMEKYRNFDHILEEISYIEKIKITNFFRLKLFKMLLIKQIKDEREFLKSDENVGLNVMKDNNGDSEKEVADIILDYQILKYSNQIKETNYIQKKAGEDRKILVLLDIEKSNVQKYLKGILDNFNFEENINIQFLNKTNRKLKKNMRDNYSKVLIISSSEIINLIDNESTIPIYFLKILNTNKRDEKANLLFQIEKIKSEMEFFSNL